MADFRDADNLVGSVYRGKDTPRYVAKDAIGEGKTKVISTIVNQPGLVLVHSKDRITAGDGAKSHAMEGKAAISTRTASSIFDFLQAAGVKTHFIQQHGDTDFVARRCHMIPIEFVTRRVATGSFLKRNPGVHEGYRFSPVKLEYFYKDDANHDPQYSEEQVLAAKLNCAGQNIGQNELDIMSKMTLLTFEILEHAFANLDCALVDMKVEFGIDMETKDILLADIIDSDSFRLWPSGDRRLMKDKQVYRELAEVTPEALETIKTNFSWIADRVQNFNTKPKGRVAVFMGSPTDEETGRRIHDECRRYGVPCEVRVTSAHKQTDNTLKLLSDYEADGFPTVFIAVAGRSNGLGPVLSGNTSYPVINCPPLTPEWGAQDVWSSLRLPSGLGCSTVTSPEAAALAAAQMLALNDHLLWAKLRTNQLNTWIELKKADARMALSEAARRTNN
jgi:phosphoribosylaminoimidazole carboxylase/phosphoribosylaminoimidazole-succinocarboxamide synthase